MSIAVSAVVRPSRLLRCALAGFTALNGVAALLLVSGALGRFSLLAVLAGACALAALLAAATLARAEMTHQIDISGPGEMHVTVQRRHGRAAGERVLLQLMPGSTVWPGCLLLLLGSAPGARPLRCMVVLPDSVAPAQFRRLAVAIRTIAGRDNIFFEAYKIL